MEAVTAPKVTPYLLRRADTACARRLARSVEGGDRSSDPVNRSRIRDAFLAAARDAHAALRKPEPADFERLGVDLFPEEQRVLEQAAHWYVGMFGARAVRYVDAGVEEPTWSKRLGVRLGGWIDLAVVDDTGAKELRQFELWNGRAPSSDPLELEAVRAAVLRLARWVGDDPLRVVWADLVRGLAVERTVDVATELPALREWLDERLAVVRTRVANPAATPGVDCDGCAVVAGCPAHRPGAHFSSPRGSLLPGIITLTPTSLDAWHRCERAWRDRHVLHLPPSDGDPGTAHGQQLHDVLRFVHEHGSCRDGAHVTEVLAAHGFDGNARMPEELERHLRRCPEAAESLGHEVTHARFHQRPLPLFMATARIDALWLHNGILDAHDYKTGRMWSDRVREDRQARLQAWVLAPFAAQLGARVRITFEHLSAEVADDPEPFEPDADDLLAIDEELRAAVASMRNDENYVGVGDAATCAHCRYRSICTDSATRGEPGWPRVEEEDNPVDDAA